MPSSSHTLRFMLDGERVTVVRYKPPAAVIVPGQS